MAHEDLGGLAKRATVVVQRTPHAVNKRLAPGPGSWAIDVIARYRNFDTPACDHTALCAKRWGAHQIRGIYRLYNGRPGHFTNPTMAKPFCEGRTRDALVTGRGLC